MLNKPCHCYLYFTSFNLVYMVLLILMATPLDFDLHWHNNMSPNELVVQLTGYVHLQQTSDLLCRNAKFCVTAIVQVQVCSKVEHLPAPMRFHTLLLLHLMHVCKWFLFTIETQGNMSAYEFIRVLLNLHCSYHFIG
jgi:hypothetical protein